MRLTKNEKKVLHLLIDNARISDSSIAEKLKISSQAVGNIRRKLEEEAIRAYAIKMDFSKFGIQTFAFALAKMTDEGIKFGELEVEQKLISEPNIITLYRVPNQHITHLIFYGFRSLEDLDEFFHSPKKKQEIHRYIENVEFFTFSYHSLIKNDSDFLFKKMIENVEPINLKKNFQEIEDFKKKLK